SEQGKTLSARSVLLKYAAAGFTTIHEMGATTESWDGLVDLADQDRLPIRVFAWISAAGDHFDTLGAAGPITSRAADMLTLRGLFITPDFKDCAPAYSAKLRNKIARANMRGFQAGVLVQGCVPPKSVYDAFNDVLAYASFDGRHRVIYADTSSALAAPLSIDANVRAAVHVPAKTSPIDVPDELSVMAATQAKSAPWLFWQMARAYGDNRAKALSALTQAPMEASFMEDRLGALEPGKWADFIILDRDVMTMQQRAIADVQVLETWVAGEKVELSSLQ
ncbi:MAG: amidohydrolase family protein, partial [Pseudomonadota bacterium]